MAKTAKATGAGELHVLQLKTGRLNLFIRGTSPLIFNAMSEKARHELLLPRGRKTGAERAENLKHDPLAEYRNSVYAHRENDKPTRLYFPCGAFKKAAMTAALDLPGMKRTEIGRLLWLNSYNVDIFGVPEMLMSVVRSADMNRTPDIRTRAILPEWACRLSINYVRPKLEAVPVGNLFSAAGVLAGIGDGRQEKGSLNFGQFEVVEEADIQTIIANGGRQAQDDALASPSFFDRETDQLYTWFEAEADKRGKERITRIHAAA